MRNKCVLLGVGVLTAITIGHVSAEEGKANYDALPDNITTEDTQVDLNVIQDMNLRKADWMLDRLRESGKPIPSNLRERIIELRRQKNSTKPQANQTALCLIGLRGIQMEHPMTCRPKQQWCVVKGGSHGGNKRKILTSPKKVKGLKEVFYVGI